MTKYLSIAFVVLMLFVIVSAISTIFLPAVHILIVAINIATVGLLITGIALIITLIIDRYKDYKKESDDYKKY